jgi:hypothetical protein
VVVPAQPLAPAEVRLATLVLPQHDVDAAALQRGDLEERAKVAVAEHHVAVIEAPVQTAE